MSKKKTEEVELQDVPRFTVRALKADGRFNNILLDAVLDPVKTYSISEVNKLIARYQPE